jgi:MinD-like ATPase involved in chromosome partitioning or flagellar assembly
MFVVTFYSFRGGVGRTMALVNIGAYLASLGRRVLLVDFDLESPGLPKYDLSRPKNIDGGIVEFVSTFLKTGEVPDVNDYVYPSDTFPGTGGRLWIMPAGKEDDSYQQRLSEINWAELYEKRDGYVLMEDLRAQWDKQLGAEYVLIDSRTGYTDIAGICTRQLPDEICMMFMPNRQNLDGLVSIAKKVRDQSTVPDLRHPKLLFAAANIPDLDDEDGALTTIMQEFKERLAYDRLVATVKHYGSMALLNQTIFSIKRSNTALAKSYQSFANRIAESNPEDRVASLAFLKGVVRSYPGGDSEYSPSDIARQVDQIVVKHDDGEVLYWAARVRETAGDWEAARDLLTRAIEAGYSNPETYLQRGLVNMLVNAEEAAEKDAVWILGQKDAKVEHVVGAAQILLRLDSRADIVGAQAVRALSEQDKLFFVESVKGSPRGLELGRPILADLLENGTLPEEARDRASRLLKTLRKPNA